MSEEQQIDVELRDGETIISCYSYIDLIEFPIKGDPFLIAENEGKLYYNQNTEY